MKFYVLGLLLVFVCASEAGEKIWVGRFSQGDLSGWENKQFNASSDYRLIEEEGDRVLLAKSHQAASGWYKKQRIDLDKTPFLNWSWRIDKRLPKLDERNKSGDDYAARIYVVISGGWAFWKTRALNYVWSGNQEKGATWANAFAGDNVMMIALRDRKDREKVWYRERRNVQQDLQKIFGERIRFVDAIAVMTDTDNSGAEAESRYGDIFFSEE